MMHADQKAVRIRVVSIGSKDTAPLRRLVTTFPTLTCHEFLSSPSADKSLALPTLLDELQRTDLLFVQASPPAESSFELARQIGKAAHAANLLTVTLTAFGESGLSDADDAVRFTLPDTLAVPTTNPPCGVIDPLHHMVTVICHLLLRESMIGIDFVDVATVLRGGRVGWLGVGRASGSDRGRSAASLALNQMLDQVGPLKVSSYLVVLQSTCLQISDFDQASTLLHAAVPLDANILFGMVEDDEFGDALGITVMAIGK